ncbi:CIR protein, partial [Plasmodium chabaudi chabaudi]
VLGGSSDLKGRLKGAEGDSYDQSTGLSGKTLGLSAQEGELIGKKGEHQVALRGYSDLSRLKGEEGDANGKYYGMKGQEGGYLGILEDITSLRDGFPGLNRGSNGKHNTLSRKSSESEILGGILPRIKMLYDSIKGISGQTYELPGQEGDVGGHHDVLIGRTKGLKGKEGDINGQRNILSSKSSEFKIIGGINPQIQMLQDSMKGTHRRTKRFADQEDGSQVVLGGSSGLRSSLKGEEGDITGKYDGFKGQEGEYIGILEDITSLRDGFPGLKEGPNGQHNVLSSKSSEFEITGGISPKINMSYDTVKGISGQAQILKYEEDDFNSQYDVLSGQTKGLKGKEGDVDGHHDVLIGRTNGLKGKEGYLNGKHNVSSRKNSESEIIGGIIPQIKILYDSIKGISGQTHELPGQEGELSGQKGEPQVALGGYSDSKGKLSGLEGNSYDQSDGLSGKTLGLPGQDGVSLGISGGHPNLRDNLSGLEGDLSGQHNVLSINNSGLEITGGITPKMNLSYDSVKGISGQSQILKGEEGDFNGKHDILIGRKTGLKGKEGDLDGQRNILSSKSSEFEIIGGMNPQIKILQDDMKGTKRRTRRFADQEDGSQVVCMCFPGLRNRLKGEEGDINGKYYGLKGQEGGYLGILEDITSLRGRFPVIKGGLNGKDNVLNGQSSGFEIIHGISPQIKMSYDTVKGISGETPILKGQEGDADGHHDVLSVRGSEFIGGITPQMKGLSGHREEYRDKEGEPQVLFGGHSGLKDGLTGQESGYLGISWAQPNLRDTLSGLEGDSNEQYNTISSKNSRPEIIGGISPKINMSYDTVKGISGETPILKGQEGDFYGHHDVLIDRTKGLKGKEGGSLNMKDVFSHFTIESENISTTTEENVNPPRTIPTLHFENPLEHSNIDSKSILTSASNSFSNFGNKITYIVVAFISFFIILGVSYKYFAPGWKKKLKREQNVKKIINLCDKNKPPNEVPDMIIEDN